MRIEGRRLKRGIGRVENVDATVGGRYEKYLYVHLTHTLPTV